MTSYSDVASKNYVCIDHAPEADRAGYEEKGGALLGPVRAICGSLPCPSYIKGKRLTCVVLCVLSELHRITTRTTCLPSMLYLDPKTSTKGFGK